MVPIPNGYTDSDESPIVHSSGRVSNFRQLVESKRPKQFIKEAQGRSSKSKPKVKKGSKPKNLRASGKGKKKGPFGESYSPVRTPSKGERVKESARGDDSYFRRLRESVSMDDLRGMLNRALRDYFPPKKRTGNGNDSSPGLAYDYSETPYVKDTFPDEKMVVFTRKDVLWAADYALSKNDGKATLSNVRRVETKYVDISDDDGDETKESGQRMTEKAPPGREEQVKKLKKNPNIDNPFAVAWAQYDKKESNQAAKVF